MHVCVCHNITDTQLINLAKQGYSVEQITINTRAGTNCGSCVGTIEFILEEHHDSSITRTSCTDEPSNTTP